MDAPIPFSGIIQGELPFTLNLPEGSYTVLVGEKSYGIDVLQDRMSAADGPDAMRVGTFEDLHNYFGERWGALYRHELRTILRHGQRVFVPRDSFIEPSEEQLFEFAQRHVLRSTSGMFSGGPTQLQERARAWLDGLSSDDRQAFGEDTSVRLTAETALPGADIALFCHSVNVLIRLYMTAFQDPFVHEICESSFSGTAFRGICATTFCNGQFLDNVHHSGGLFPFVMRSPWLEHKPEAIEAFRVALGDFPEPDPVTLMGVRARSLLLHGGYRSAIVEASAALDLAVSRKIRQGLAKLGDSERDISHLLRREMRFEERCKRILVNATGYSAAGFDNGLWESVLKHRATLRQGVTHADREPAREEAEVAVDSFLRLAKLVDSISV